MDNTELYNTLICLNCKIQKDVTEDDIHVKYGINYFCSGKCEDTFTKKSWSEII